MNEASVRALSGFDGVEVLGGAPDPGRSGRPRPVAAARQILGRAKRAHRSARPGPPRRRLILAVRAAARRTDTGRPEVKISDAIDQPLLAGLATPVILLPADLIARLDVARLVPICAHELAARARRQLAAAGRAPAGRGCSGWSRPMPPCAPAPPPPARSWPTPWPWRTPTPRPAAAMPRP
ncbi:hypothetical protein ACRAWD_01980 [Caulobacter segnis]